MLTELIMLLKNIWELTVLVLCDFQCGKTQTNQQTKKRLCIEKEAQSLLWEYIWIFQKQWLYRKEIEDCVCKAGDEANLKQKRNMKGKIQDETVMLIAL